MSTTATNFTEEFVPLDFGKVHLMKGGTGKPIVLFQDDLGSPGWLPFYEELAGSSTVYVPSHPGFGKSERPDWMRSARDLALSHLWFMKTLDLEPVSVVGIGFGGWVAAEMATMCHHLFDRIVLVGAVGVQPTAGEILDQCLLSGEEYAKLCFHDSAKYEALYGAETTVDQREAWELNREMVIRLAWKPYMFDQALPHLLGSVEAPTLVVSAENDKIVPASCGQRYADLLPKARLEVLNGCGHCADMEKPVELAELISGFMSRE